MFPERSVMLCVGPVHWLSTTSPSSHSPHLTKQISQPGFELNVNRQKSTGKGLCGVETPSPHQDLLYIFLQTTANGTRIFWKCYRKVLWCWFSKWWFFSVFPYSFGLKQFEEKFRSKQMAGCSGWSSQGGSAQNQFRQWLFLFFNLKKTSSQL